MASNVVRATLLADAQRFKAGFKEAEQSTQTFGKSVVGVSDLVVAAIAVKAASAVKDFVTSSVRAFSNLEQSTGSVKSVFGDTADVIEDFARGSDQAVGLSESAFKQLAAVIGGQLQNMGFSVDEAATKTIDLVKAGADMAATYGGPASEAVAAISSLLRGERDSIEKYAVSIKDADVQARSLALGLDTSTTEAKKNADAISALDILTAQVGKTQGQFAREVDSVAGSSQRASAALEDMKAVVGQQFAPTIVAAMKEAIPWIAKAGQAVIDLGGFFTSLGQIGDVTAMKIGEVERAFQKASIATDGMVDSAEEVFLVLKDLLNPRSLDSPEALERFIDLMGNLPVDELNRMRGASDELWASIGLAPEVLGELQEMLEDKIVSASRAARDQGLHGVERAMEDVAGETGEATDALQSYIDKLKELTDPVFAAMNAVNDLKDAQAHLVEVQGDSEASAADLAEAELEVATALLGAQGAMDALDSTTLNAAIDAIATVLGKSKDEVILLLQQLDILDGKQVTTFIDTHRRTFTGPGSGGVLEHAAHGGHRRKGVPVIIGEEGEEVFVPDEDGTIIPNHAISRGGSPVGMGGPPIIINVHGSIVTERDLIDVVHEGLLRLQRRIGGLGFTR